MRDNTDETNNEQTALFTPGAGAPMELTALTVNGPDAGVVKTNYAFTATVIPITTTTPITYTWQATGQAPIAHSSGVTDTAHFAWAEAGTKAITVTATGPQGLVVGAHTLTLSAVIPGWLYLPLVVR